jgi:thiosulfate dehydrogenase
VRGTGKVWGLPYGVPRRLGLSLLWCLLLLACQPLSDVADTRPTMRVADRVGALEAPWPSAVPLADTLSPSEEARRIRRGRAILANTRDSLPAFVGNALRCTSCHLDDGRRKDALPWVGVLARFPQYRPRNAQVNQIDDRINDCFQRSLAGRALPHDSEAMRDIVRYLRFLSHGVPYGARLQGQGAPAVSATDGDGSRGATVFASRCARCHGADGQGTPLAPPVWGDGAYSIGAGMGRPRTAAAFIRANMPLDQPHGTPTLDDQQALDVATYINTQGRRDFAPKGGDWPFGGAPVDVPYRTAGRARAP